MKKNHKYKAFSLLEIGIVLLIMGIIGWQTVPFMQKALNGQHLQSIKKKHEFIVQSLAAYTLQHGHLPAASLPLQNGKSIPQRSIGIVPYQSLNIDPSFVKDAHGRFFTYAVNVPLTGVRLDKNVGESATDLHLDNSETSFCSIPLTDKYLKIKDFEMNNDGIAFILIAHHKGYGAFYQNNERETTLLTDKMTRQEKAEQINYSDSGFFSTKDVRDTIFWISRYNFMTHFVKKPCDKRQNTPTENPFK